MSRPKRLLVACASCARASAISAPTGSRPPSFVMFILESGLAQGVSGIDCVLPSAISGGGGSELGSPVAENTAVDATHEAWRAKRAAIVLPPTEVDFGRSFVATDPDGPPAAGLCGHEVT